MDEMLLNLWLLTGEVDRLLQMHHGDVGLFAPSVVASVDDDAIDSSGLNLRGARVALRVKPEDSSPGLEVDIFPARGEVTLCLYRVFMSL